MKLGAKMIAIIMNREFQTAKIRHKLHKSTGEIYIYIYTPTGPKSPQNAQSINSPIDSPMPLLWHAALAYKARLLADVRIDNCGLFE